MSTVSDSTSQENKRLDNSMGFSNNILQLYKCCFRTFICYSIANVCVSIYSHFQSPKLKAQSLIFG